MRYVTPTRNNGKTWTHAVHIEAVWCERDPKSPSTVVYKLPSVLRNYKAHSLRKKPTFRDAGHHWFPREMTSEDRAQKFHSDDALLPRSE